VLERSNDSKNDNAMKVIDPLFDQLDFFVEHVLVVKKNDLQVGCQEKTT
jgi:hypothetical protein